MSIEEDDTLPMDQSDLVDGPTLQHELTEEPKGDLDENAGQPRDENGRFASKETGEVETPAATPAENPIPEDQFKGYLTEKRKRQELESQVAAMHHQLAQFQTQQQAPEFWENPDAALQQRLDQFGQSLLQQFQQQQQAERVNVSEAAARAKYTDYGDAFQAFQQAVQFNPSLAHQMMMATDPGEFAYRAGKRSLDLEKVGSIDGLIAAERAKWEAEVRAAAPTPQRTFPTSTVIDGSVASRGGPVWSGPVLDKDILPMG